MKTDDLIGLLAADTAPVDRGASQRRFAFASLAGMAVAGAMMASLLHVRPDLAEAVLWPKFWLKVLFVAGLALAGLMATTRLGRPGARSGGAWAAAGALLLVMWAIGAGVLFVAAPEQRESLFFGATWKVCPFLIALLSVPMFAAVMWAMRGFAPTHLRRAGFAAGLFSGAAAALIYCLHCPEIGAPFVGFWYVLGMLIPACAGALLGERLLRW